MPHQLPLQFEPDPEDVGGVDTETSGMNYPADAASADQPSARDLEAGLRNQLDERLAGRLGRLTLTENRSTLITAKPRPNGLDIRLHWSFVHAEPEILEALIELAQGPRRGPAFRGALTRVRAHAAPFLRSEQQPPPDLPVTSPPRQILVEQGVAHNLGVLFERLNEQYFDGEIEASITWGGSSTVAKGRRGRRRRPRRRSIRLGSYLASQRLIRIHPVLDDATVPEYVVASVVHHEMAHAIAPPRPSRSGADGRRHVHTPEFRQHERRFEHFDEAQRWINDNLGELFKRRR